MQLLGQLQRRSMLLAAASHRARPRLLPWNGTQQGTQHGAQPAALLSTSRQASAASRGVAAAQAPSSAGQPDARACDYPIEDAGLTPGQLQQLRTYLDYMLEVNKSMNLTAVRDPEEAWQRHIGDSLALLPIIERHAASSLAAPSAAPPPPPGAGAPGSKGERAGRGKRGGRRGQQRRPGRQDPGLGSDDERVGASSDWWASSGGSGGAAAAASSLVAPGSTSGSGGGDGSDGGGSGAWSVDSLRVIDVGTGAGLPGMVLAVARPQWRVTLLDTLRKRCDFLQAAAERAGLTNVDVVWSRAEDGGRQPHLREGYDLAVARAVADTRVLAELCLPFVRVGGLWVAPKGPNSSAEVESASAAIGALGGRLLALELVQSFGPEGQRTAVVASKATPTPAAYPRRAGTPNKDPL